MHLTTTALPHLKCHVTQSGDLQQKSFSTKILFTEFGSHKIMVGTQKKFSLVKIYIKKCAVVAVWLDASTIKARGGSNTF